MKHGETFYGRHMALSKPAKEEEMRNKQWQDTNAQLQKSKGELQQRNRIERSVEQLLDCIWEVYLFRF